MFADLSWYRLKIKLVNTRWVPSASAHPFSIFQAMVKGVTTISLSRFPKPEDSKNSENTKNTTADKFPTEPIVFFHITNKKHTFTIHKSDTIPLEIIFLRADKEFVSLWRDSLQVYFADHEQAKNYDIVQLGEIEYRSFEQLVSEIGVVNPEKEICLEFLTPFPFKPKQKKRRTYIDKQDFIHAFERRFSRLFGKEIVYHSDADNFSILPYYWNYTEIRRVSVSQPTQIQYINGCVGKLYIKGFFRDFLPFIILGTELHTGAKLSYSQGYYLLHKDSSAYFSNFFPDKKAIISVIREVIDRYDYPAEYCSETEEAESKKFDEEKLAQAIYQELADNSYTPAPNKAFLVKGKNNVLIQLERVPVKDLIIQQYLVNTILPILDRIFDEDSLGFRKATTSEKVIAFIQSAIKEGYQYVIESSLTDFLSSINLDILIRLIDFYLPAKDTLIKNLLTKCIKTGYIIDNEYHRRIKGLPPGSPLSSILASLYLDYIDKQKLNWKPDIKIIRYADTFLIFTKTKEIAESILSKTESYLSESGVKVKKEKTDIKPIKDGFYFLGTRFDLTETESQPDLQEELQQLKKPLYITEPYLFLSLNGDAIEICKSKKVIETIPLLRVSEIIVMEKSSFSTALIKKCIQFNIPLTIALESGYNITTIKPESKKYYDIAFEHAKKYYSLSESEMLSIAKEFGATKLKNYISLFRQRYSPQINIFIKELEETIQKIYQSTDLNEVRGLEGAITRKIYQQLNNFIENKSFYIRKRDREEPDKINSLMNLGYYLLFSRINATIRAVGLNPYLGFLHSPYNNYESFACDIQDLFRARIDRFIIKLINLKIITEDDFVKTKKGFYLKKEAHKKFINQFEAEMERKTAKSDKSNLEPALSLKESIYQQVVSFKKWVLEGSPLWFYHWNV